MRLTALALPEVPHIPGRNVRPEAGLFFDIAQAAPETTDPARWRDNRAWLYGVDLYAGGFFWETHEVWEPVWMGARPNSPERTLVQGLIHLANACLKLEMSRLNAARRLTALAAGCLGDARSAGPTGLMGVDMPPLLADLDRFATLLRNASGADGPVGARPVLRLAGAVEEGP
ncbi:MAG: DUF309 domain-containing protein [Rhizobiaceae bacterium]|nr:DUF309 domain-containing protein [Rhizobiaceae bacterium]MCV0406004.1 DUF309 domain-containing protein [Rhizobiaceae bacterium]